jgi:hypothetical protein
MEVLFPLVLGIKIASRTATELAVLLALRVTRATNEDRAREAPNTAKRLGDLILNREKVRSPVRSTS